MARKLSMDWWLVGTVLALTLFGLTMVFSASAMLSIRTTGSSVGFLFKQTVATILGLCLLFGATRIDYRRLRSPVVIWGLLVACLVMLLAVLAGGTRWLNFGGFSFQPSELTKLALILFLADLLARKNKQLNDLRHVIVPCLLLVGTFCALIYVQPDFGSTATVALITICLFFIAGVPIHILGGLGLAGGAALAVLAVRAEYRLQRLIAFWNPDLDPRGLNFQMNQSLIAVGAGGVAGVGLGQSTQKLFFLPAAHTDFIFAVIGEELGFIGCVAVILAFTILLVRGSRAALKAPDPFGAYLAAGITLSLVIQAFINMGVVLGLLPTKGLPLPFVSYGGSSLLVSLLAAGLILNVSQHTT
ncbi:MAG: putative lipid II flippase FtsW [Acidobacteriota bacterium]